MDRKPTPRKTNSPQGIKWMVAAFSMASTLGLWSLFSRQLDQPAAASVQAAVIPTQPVAGLALDLPPLPTLVSLADHPVALNATVNNAAVQPARVQSQPAAAQQAPVKIIIQGAKAPRKAAPAPVTSTRSSR